MSIYIPYNTRNSYGGRQGPVRGQAETPPGRQARPDRTRKSYGRRQGPVRRQAETPPGRQRPSPSRAPTRTSRRAGIGQGDLPQHKGYNQFIKDARRSQRATQLSQLKQMEGKI